MLQNSLGLPVCDFKGLCWWMVSKGRIWYQRNEVSAAKGNSVAWRAHQCTSAACSPQAVQPRTRCHAGVPRRADAHLSKASSPPGEGEGCLRKEDRKGGEFAEMHTMDPLQPDFQSWTFKWHQLSCPCSEIHWSQQSHTWVVEMISLEEEGRRRERFRYIQI